MESKANYLKSSLEEKQGEVTTKDNTINSLRKDIEVMKSKAADESKNRSIEKENMEKEI